MASSSDAPLSGEVKCFMSGDTNCKALTHHSAGFLAVKMNISVFIKGCCSQSNCCINTLIWLTCFEVLIFSFCASYRRPCIVFVFVCFSSTFQLYFIAVKGRISIGVLGGLRFLKEMMQNRKWMNTKVISKFNFSF